MTCQLQVENENNKQVEKNNVLVNKTSGSKQVENNNIPVNRASGPCQAEDEKITLYSQRGRKVKYVIQKSKHTEIV